MIGEKIELTDHVDSIYDFVLDVSYKEEQMRLTLYKKGAFLKEEVLSGNYRDKKAFKNPVKKAVYRLFSYALDKELPWGTLTGVRPTKIVFDGLAEGKTQAQIIEDFQKDYLLEKKRVLYLNDMV